MLRQILLFLILLFLFPAGALFAQNGDQLSASSFDCESFLKGVDFRERPGADRPKLHDMRFPVSKDMAADAIRLETGAKQPGGPQVKPVATAVAGFFDDDRKVYCDLFRAAFIQRDIGNSLRLSLDSDERSARHFSLLVLFSTSKPDAWIAARKNWENRYEIDANFDVRYLPGTVGETGIELDGTKFVLAGLSKSALQLDQFALISEKSIPPAALSALPKVARPGTSGMSDWMIVFCFPNPCQDIARKDDNVAGTSTPGRTLAPKSSQFPFPRPARSSVEPGLAPVGSQHTAAGNGPTSNSDYNTGPEIAPPTSRDVARIPSIRAVTRSGEHKPVPMDRIGGLPCLLDALAPQLFDVSSEICDQKTVVKLRNEFQNGQIEILPDSSWLIRTGNKLTYRVESITIIAEPGQTTASCELRVRFPVTGEAGIAYDLVPEDVAPSEPREFTVDLSYDPLDLRPGTRLVVEVNNPGECGAPGRELMIERPENKLRFDLSNDSRPTRAILYLPLFNDQSLSRLGLTPGDRLSLARGMRLAIESAHLRLSSQADGKPWALRIARTELLSQGQSETVQELSGSALRQPEPTFLKDAFAGSAPKYLDRPFVASAANTLAELSRNPAGFNNVDEVVVVTMGRYLGRLEDLDPLCRDLQLNELLDGLARLGRPSFRIVSFPIIRLRGPLPLSVQEVALPGYNPDLAGLPANPVSCRNNTDEIAIFPFFAQSWRNPEDVIQRYGTGLGDQLGLLLETLAIRK